MSSSKNSNSGMAVPEAKEAMRQFKEEVASELGVNLKDGYNGGRFHYFEDHGKRRSSCGICKL